MECDWLHMSAMASINLINEKFDNLQFRNNNQIENNLKIYISMNSFF